MCARDIVLQHMWNGRTAVETPLQLSHPVEQLEADRGLADSSRNSTGMHLQGRLCLNSARQYVHVHHCFLHVISSNGPAEVESEDAEVLLERLGYKVFFGGVYSVEDYRAM